MLSVNATIRRVREELYGRDVADLMELNDGDFSVHSDWGVDLEWQ